MVCDCEIAQDINRLLNGNSKLREENRELREQLSGLQDRINIVRDGMQGDPMGYAEKLQSRITELEAERDNAFEAGESKQAILELHGRDRFLESIPKDIGDAAKEISELKRRLEILEARERWVPVSDPPIIGQWYGVVFEGGYRSGAFWDDMEQCFFTWSQECRDLVPNDSMTHYCELPSPPVIGGESE